MITSLFTPWRILLVTVLAVAAYCFFIGLERFFYESAGTLILSPNIYVQLLPAPLNRWLLALLVKDVLFSYLITAVPIAILLISAALGTFSIRRKSVWMAILSSGMVLLVFAVYHCLQPMGLGYYGY